MVLFGRAVSVFSFIGLFCLLAVGSAFGAEASLEATISKRTLSLDDLVTLTVTATDIDGEPEMPDISGSFTIVSRSTSRSMTIINMQAKSSTRYTYVLRPEKSGRNTIPTITARAGAKRLKTAPITINVLEPKSGSSEARVLRPRAGQTPPAGRGEPERFPAAAGDENIFVHLTADKNEVFLGEQITLTFKLYTRTDLASADYTPPACTNFWKEDIEERRSYKTVVDGKRYRVQEIKTAVFPTKTGKQKIGPATIDCTFDTFFSFRSPFGRSGQMRPKKLRTEPIVISVMPLPEGAPEGFSGAVGQFSIVGNVDKTSVDVGKPLTFHIKIWGTGNVQTIPRIELPTVDGFDKYEPDVREVINRKTSPIKGSKTFEFVMVPKQPGIRSLPIVAFTYFDPKTRRYRTVSTRAISITVTGSLPPATAQGSGGGLPQKAGVSQLATDIHHIKPKMTVFRSSPQDLFRRPVTKWLLFLPALFVFAIWAKGIAHRSLFRDTGVARIKAAGKHARKELKRARAVMRPEAAGEFYSQVAKLLTGYLAVRFDVPAPGISAMTIGSLVGDSAEGKKASSLAAECFELCDFHRFSAQNSTEEEMNEVLLKIEEVITTLEKLKPANRIDEAKTQ